MTSQVPFQPSADVAAVLHNLLDQYERRHDPLARAIRCDLEALALPGYGSQRDPEPRRVANDQLRHLAAAGVVALTWLVDRVVDRVVGRIGRRVPDVVYDEDG